MSYLFSIAFKNISRYKRRTILTFLILTVGIAIYIMMNGLLKGADEQSFRNQIEFETGDFKVRSQAFDDDHPYTVSNFILDYRKIEDVLRTKKYVRAFTERLNFSAELDNTKVSTPALIVGVNPATENSVFTFTNFITEGGLESGGAVVGKNLAKDMALSVGDTVYITFRNEQGMMDSIELTVSGIMNSPNPQVNNSTVFIGLDEAMRYLNTKRVTEIVMKTTDFNKYKSFEPDLKASLPGFQVINWQKLGEEFLAVGQAKSKGAGLILVFIAIIAIVGIVNTMMMSVYEKKREIGTLKALGMRDRDVRSIFVYEGMMIGLLGSVTGIILGALVNLYFVTVGIDITAMLGNSNMDIGYKVMGVLKSKWDVSSMVQSFFMGMIFSVLASYYPANKTTKMQPMECLRTVQ